MIGSLMYSSRTMLIVLLSCAFNSFANETNSPPRKTATQLRQERIKKMRESVSSVNKKTLSDADIVKLLNKGYKKTVTTHAPEDNETLSYSLIKDAFESKWQQPVWSEDLRPMMIRVWFGEGGKIVRCELEVSSTVKAADDSIIKAASRVGTVQGLPQPFIDKYKDTGVPIRFTVRPN